MRKSRYLWLIPAVLSLFVIAACAASKAQKEVDIAAQDVVTKRAELSVLPNDPAKQAAYIAATDRYAASVKAYEEAKARDDVSWEGLAAIAGVAGAALGFPIGGLIDPFRKLVTGRRQGATLATTAITNADHGDVLQSPVAKDNIASALTTAPPEVAKAVADHI